MGSGYRSLYGVEEYAVTKWGPQRIRLAWKGAQNNLSMMARAKSDIKTMADLKGRRVGVYAGGEGYISACLAFAGLTLDDVKVVPATGYTGALNMLLENKVEAAYRRGDLFAKRGQMMQEWANYLDRLKAGAEVVALRDHRS